MAVTKEAQAQLALLPERVAVVEIKVAAINEKLTDIKSDVKDMHDCLDQTRDLLAEKLKEMSEASNSQHADLYSKIGELEKFKHKWMMYVMVLLAFGAGTGWFDKLDIPHLFKFLGL